MKDFEFGLPHKYKKAGFGLIIISIIQFAIMIVFKKEMTVEFKSTLYISLKVIFSLGILVIIYTEEKKQDERMAIYKLKALANGFAVVTLYLIASMTFNDDSTIMSSPMYHFFMGIIAYFVKLYRQLRRDESY